MIRFEKLNPEVQYPYADATTAAAYVNGTIGTVSGNVFTAGAGAYCIMQVEQGDAAYTDEYTIPMGAHARVANLAHADVVGEIVNITKAQLPETYAVGNKLAATSAGKLSVSTTSPLFEVVTVTDYGVRAKVLGN